MEAIRRTPNQLCDWNLQENLNAAYRFYSNYRPSRVKREAVRKLLEFVQKNDVCSVKRILSVTAKIEGYREFLFSVDELAFAVKRGLFTLVKVNPSSTARGDILVVANMQVNYIEIGQVLVVNQGVVLNGQSKPFKGKVVSKPYKDEAKFGNKLFYVDLKIQLPVELKGTVKPVAIHRLEHESKAATKGLKTWTT